MKYDGFRSLAVIQNGRCQLISRNGHPFNSVDTLRKVLVAPSEGQTVFDGEIVCLDKRGRPQFNDLLFHRGEPCFFAFDLLMSNGRDLRSERLTDRKHELRRLLSKAPASVSSRMVYVDHVEHHGTALFQRVCEMDLEGTVAKHSKASVLPVLLIEDEPAVPEYVRTALERNDYTVVCSGSGAGEAGGRATVDFEANRSIRLVEGPKLHFLVISKQSALYTSHRNTELLCKIA